MAEDAPRNQLNIGNENVQVMGNDNIITLIRASSSHDWRRSDLLQQVHNHWIVGLLEPSLSDAIPLRLQFSIQSETIEKDEDTLLSLVQEMKPFSFILSEGTDILQAFEQAKHQLLVLGEPGSGKTILLLQLTRELLLQASQDERQPIPVVFPLSAWTPVDKKNKQLSFDNWLVKELQKLYKIPLKVAKQWIDDGKILPLLDGLDEVSTNDRKGCIQAINAYHQQHRIQLVICSRRQDYLDIGVKLHLGGAIIVQPLTKQQVDTNLSSKGEQSPSLLRRIVDDPVLDELIARPLIFQILMKTDQKELLENISAGDSLETQQRQFFALYVKHMLQRRKFSSDYKNEQTIFLLTCLARQLVHHNQIDYKVTGSIWQPRERAWLGTLFGFGIVFSLGFGIVFGLFWALHFSILFSFLMSLGITVVIDFGIGALSLIVTALGNVLFGTMPGLEAKPAISALPRLYSESIENYLGITMLLSLVEGIIAGFGIGFLLSLALLSNINITLIVIMGLLSVSILWIFLGYRQFWLGNLFCMNLFWWYAWRYGYRPFQYKRFLDYAVDRIFMYKVGDQYRFVHRLLRDYFASLS